MPIVLRSQSATRARELIASGEFEINSPWSFSSEDGDKILGNNGTDWPTFANFHLGEETEVTGQNKARYKYTMGKGGKIYATALRAVRIRAEREGDKVIFNEAGRLLNLISANETKPAPAQVGGNILQFKNLGQVRQLARTSDETVGEMELFGVVGGSWYHDAEGITQENFNKTLKGFGPKVTTVNLMLNSPGGDVFQGRAIANMIKQSDKTFNINVIGEASSAASIIAMAGDAIHMSQGTLMLIHRCYTLAMGNSVEMAKISKELNVVDQEAVDIYAARSKMNKADILALMDENRYMTAQEAYDKGFCDSVDEVATGAKTKQARSNSIFALSEADRKKLHLPALPESHQPNRFKAQSIIDSMKKGLG